MIKLLYGLLYEFDVTIFKMSMMTIRLEETRGDSKNEVDEENKVLISKLSPTQLCIENMYV